MTELEEGARLDAPDEPLPAGSYVFVEVEDSGVGIDEETRHRMFDPFFTTKFTGRGLGLASVLGILRGHRAGAVLDTAPGEGTCFRVLFPVLDDDSAEVGSQGLAEIP